MTLTSTADLTIFRTKGVRMIDERVWSFLPARPDRRRVTTPDVIALHLSATVQEVGDALRRLESAGRIVRDAKLGTRTGWHRAEAAPMVADPEPGLFGDVS